MKDDGIPFKSVFESNLEMSKVKTTPSTITAVRNSAERADWKAPEAAPAKNMVIIAISVGKRPLHGTKLFVRIAMSLSRGESIILQPITPQALQPNPMQIVCAIM